MVGPIHNDIFFQDRLNTQRSESENQAKQIQEFFFYCYYYYSTTTNYKIHTNTTLYTKKTAAQLLFFSN